MIAVTHMSAAHEGGGPQLGWPQARRRIAFGHLEGKIDIFGRVIACGTDALDHGGKRVPIPSPRSGRSATMVKSPSSNRTVPVWRCQAVILDLNSRHMIG
jgi:hypothetical protein